MRFSNNDPILKERRKELRSRMTAEEHLLWSELRGRKFHGFKFHRQFSIDRFILDFYCPELRLAIEIDGSQHYSEDGLVCDQERDTVLHSHGISVVRFKNEELLEMSSVLAKLEERLPLEYKRERGS
jgi:very-short-patch-repair endonuclease